MRSVTFQEAPGFLEGGWYHLLSRSARRPAAGNGFAALCPGYGEP